MDTSSSVADRQPQHPRVRRATGEDLPDAARVQSECLAEIGAGSIDADVLAALTSEDAVESTVEQWRQLYDEGAQFWVLDDDGAIVGVAMTRRMPPAEAPTTLELATIHVMPRARLRGVADELLSSAIGQEPAFVWVQRLDWLDGSVKLGGLVLDVEGNLLELVLMHVCVVSAEQ